MGALQIFLVIVLFVIVFTITVFIMAYLQISRAKSRALYIKEELDKVETDEIIDNYNYAVSFYNTSIKMIPGRFIANFKGYEPMELFEK
ncbi:MAG: hypothetical protein K5656_09980 [Lachnospiraceae bacterium]|nr:hypothetical protein [Lachnospiraceae bacterium]